MGWDLGFLTQRKVQQLRLKLDLSFAWAAERFSAGLAVDYAVYFCQRFMTTDAPDGDARMKIAMADTGSAVFLGGLTALLGSVPMAFSKSVIIRTFFRLIFGTIL